MSGDRADDPGALVAMVRTEHVEQDLDPSDDAIPGCMGCDQDWPCLPARLADALERQLAIYAEYGAISNGVIEDMRADRDRFRAQAHQMMTPCQCDPLQAGEELCNGGCVLTEERDAARAAAAAARAALARYGRHGQACPARPRTTGGYGRVPAAEFGPCDCGLQGAQEPPP